MKRELEKADQPKREVKKRTEWTVEFIKVIIYSKLFKINFGIICERFI